jgi:hypothetical protein
MGLDMYIYKTSKDYVELDDNLLVKKINRFYQDENEDIDDDEEDDYPSSVLEEFFYWRKHPAIHVWMEKLYIERGGSQTFNGEYVYLDEETLKKLKKDIVKKKLEYDATGFFFGKSSDPRSQEGIVELKRDLKVVNSVLKHLKEDPDIVFIYDSSW